VQSAKHQPSWFHYSHTLARSRYSQRYSLWDRSDAASGYQSIYCSNLLICHGGVRPNYSVWDSTSLYTQLYTEIRFALDFLLSQLSCPHAHEYVTSTCYQCTLNCKYRPTVRFRKRSHAWVAISLTLTFENGFLQFEQKCYWEIKQSKRCFIFPPRLTSVSALCTTWWNRKPENVYFHLNAACCFANKHAKHVKYYIVTAEPPFTVKTIDCTYQTGPEREHSILQQVTPTVDIYQVCHAVGHNVN